MEAAGNYWQAYKTTLAPDAPAMFDVNHHMKTLPQETIAAGWYYRIQDLSEKIRKTIEATRADDDWREKAQDAVRDMMGWVGEAQEAKDKLTGADLAGTVWASSIREEPNPTTVYAGPPIPASYFEKDKKKPAPPPDKPK